MPTLEQISHLLKTVEDAAVAGGAQVAWASIELRGVLVVSLRVYAFDQRPSYTIAHRLRPEWHQKIDEGFDLWAGFIASITTQIVQRWLKTPPKAHVGLPTVMVEVAPPGDGVKA